MQRTTDVVVVGAGQAGLAASRCLTDDNIDHVVVEARTVASAWRHERWDSLRLLTPNFMTRLPGFAYAGPDPTGYMTAAEVETMLSSYASSFGAPVLEQTPVSRITDIGGTHRLDTEQGPVDARAVVLATGAASKPRVPGLAARLPPGLQQLTPTAYRNPQSVAPGRVLVVGASASGIQIADELARDGREVTVCVGDHVRLPRTYRGTDIHTWMEDIGVLDEHIHQMEDPVRARRLPSLQLIGTPEKRSLDLNELMRRGVRIAGRLVGVSGNTLQFAGSVANFVKSADLKLGRLLDTIDDHIADQGLGEVTDPGDRPAPVVLRDPLLVADVRDYSVVVWATGFAPHHPWLEPHLLDPKGAVIHECGRMIRPGMFILGLPFMRRRKSSFIDGVADDARYITSHLRLHLDATAGRGQTQAPHCPAVS